jgi:hypothetical protein
MKQSDGGVLAVLGDCLRHDYLPVASRNEMISEQKQSSEQRVREILAAVKPLAAEILPADREAIGRDR